MGVAWPEGWARRGEAKMVVHWLVVCPQGERTPEQMGKWRAGG